MGVQNIITKRTNNPTETTSLKKSDVASAQNKAQTGNIFLNASQKVSNVKTNDIPEILKVNEKDNEKGNSQSLTDGQIKSAKLYNRKNVTHLNPQDYHWQCPNPDFIYQSKYKGNCYQLAGISSLADSKAGQEILNNAIKRSDDGTYYDVKMAGIDANVRVSIDEINDALKENDRTYGDVNVVLLEVATKKAAEYYLEKAKDSNNGQSFTEFLRSHNISVESENYWANSKDMKNCVNKYIENVEKNDPDTAAKLDMLDLRSYEDYKGKVLEGGYGPDWVKLMVPKGSYTELYADNYMLKSREAKNGLLDKMEKASANGQKAPTLNCDFPRNIESDNPMNARIMLKSDMKSGNTSKSITRNLIPANSKNDDIRMTMNSAKYGITSNHAYHVTKVTKDSVYMVNPWNTSVVYEIPREQFLDHNKSLGYVEIDKNANNAINFLKQFMPSTKID